MTDRQTVAFGEEAEIWNHIEGRAETITPLRFFNAKYPNDGVVSLRNGKETLIKFDVFAKNNIKLVQFRNAKITSEEAATC